MRTSLDLTAVTTCRDGLILEVQVLGWRVRVPWAHVAGVWTEEEDAAGCVLAIEAFSRPVLLAMDDAPQQYAMWCDMAGAAVVMRAWHDWGPESLGGAVQRVEAVAVADEDYAPDDGALIRDGLGGEWPQRCPTCRDLTMQIVRPGKAQCVRCG